jgi:hypothetical protein
MPIQRNVQLAVTGIAQFCAEFAKDRLDITKVNIRVYGMSEKLVQDLAVAMVHRRQCLLHLINEASLSRSRGSSALTGVKVLGQGMSAPDAFVLRVVLRGKLDLGGIALPRDLDLPFACVNPVFCDTVFMFDVAHADGLANAVAPCAGGG